MKCVPVLTIIVSLYLACAVSLNAQAKPSTSGIYQPYTAEYRITRVQTLADGTTITHVSTEVIARDSEMRHYLATTEEGERQNTHASITNPVDGIQADWDSRSKSANVVKLPPQEQRQGCWSDDAGLWHMNWPATPATAGAAASSPPKMIPPQVHNDANTESLGTQTIQGVEAIGTRKVQTVPAGADGNDAPMVTTEESWWSNSLGILVRLVRDDPRNGTTTRELVNLTVGEPDPALFQPPDGYAVKTIELHSVNCAN